MMEDENTVTTTSPGVLKTEDFLAIYRRLDKEVQEAIQNEIRKEYDYSQETALLIQKITDEKHEEHQLLSIYKMSMIRASQHGSLSSTWIKIL